MRTINTDKLLTAYEQDRAEIADAEEKAKTLRTAMDPYVEAGLFTSEAADNLAGSLVKKKQKQFDAKWATLAGFVEDTPEELAQSSGASAEVHPYTHDAYWSNPAPDASVEGADAETAAADAPDTNGENI